MLASLVIILNLINRVKGVRQGSTIFCMYAINYFVEVPSTSTPWIFKQDNASIYWKQQPSWHPFSYAKHLFWWLVSLIMWFGVFTNILLPVWIDANCVFKKLNFVRDCCTHARRSNFQSSYGIPDSIPTVMNHDWENLSTVETDDSRVTTINI
jgi:hypothetical protein